MQEIQYDIDDDCQYHADNQKTHYREIDSAIVSLNDDIARQLSQKGDMSTER